MSLLGDQFFLVALPWLVLQLTGDAFAVGAVVAVNAAPRAVFILLGGVLIDRLSPRTVMLYSNIARMVLVAVLARSHRHRARPSCGCSIPSPSCSGSDTRSSCRLCRR